MQASSTRLLYWTETFWPIVGGVESYANQFIPVIQELGYEVAVVTVRLHDLPEEETVDGITVYRLPFHDVLRGRDPGAFIELRKRVEAIRRNFQPDIVHVNLYGPSVAMLAETNRRAPLPTVIALHQKLTGIDSFGGILQRLFDQASWVTTVSAAALGDLKAAFPQLSENTSFIHNGIATDPFKPTPPAADIPRIVCIGRIVASKGFDLAIEAFAKLRAVVPAVQLTIVGDGPEKEVLLGQVRNLGLSEFVSFAGEVGPDEVREYIRGSNVVVVPSREHESFGLVAVEAALMERPVVASRLGGLAEIVVDGKTGFLVEQEDAAEIARRLEQILTQPQLATKFGTAARERALKKFSIGVNAAAYDALYRRVLDAS
jgi:glycosyltransferase involved in cell wall biosynthesis